MRNAKHVTLLIASEVTRQLNRTSGCVTITNRVKRLAKSTPNLELQVVSSSHIDAVRQLEECQADLVIGSFGKLPESVRRKTLLREDEVIVVRARHPLTRDKVTKDKLDGFPHIILPLSEENKSEADRQGSYPVSVERALQEFQEGKISPTGRATVSVPNFAAIVSFLQMSDMVAIAPRRLALWAAANAPLFLLNPPYPGGCRRDRDGLGPDLG